MTQIAIKANDLCWCGSGKKFKRCHKSSPSGVIEGRVTPMLEVPSDIPRPEYVATGNPGPRVEPMVKDPEIIDRMRVAGRVAAEVLAETLAAVAPGVTTDHLDRVAHNAYLSRGAYPSTLNYHHYPKSICTSVNEVICHGIPDDRALEDGDIVNIDVTAFIGGVHGDCSATALVGEVDEESRRLVEVTEQSRDLGIAAALVGRPISDIGKAIQTYAEAQGFGVVRTFIGHGIGKTFHGFPNIPHYYSPEASTIIEAGMTFTVEPMITVGSWKERMWDNGWTAVTTDGRRTAQFEHTLVTTDHGPEVLTLLPA